MRPDKVATVHVLRPPASDFDDFPEPARQVGDRFFADWIPQEPEAVPARSRRGAVLGIAAVLAAVVAVAAFAGRQQAVLARQPGAAVAPRTVTLSVDPAVVVGNVVELRWRSNADLEYAVVVSGAALPVDVVLVNRERSARVPVEPGRSYCFAVQGTDGKHVYQSAPRPIRGAVCPR